MTSDPKTPLLAIACAWCREKTEARPGFETFCHHCGHRADVPPTSCNCARCSI